MDSEGNDIEGEDLGLLLYRGGTVCDDYFDNTAADAICKYMNYTSASSWTSDQSYAIQYRFPINLDDVECSRAEWESCTFAEEHDCDHDEDVFLSCTFEEGTDDTTGNLDSINLLAFLKGFNFQIRIMPQFFTRMIIILGTSRESQCRLNVGRGPTGYRLGTSRVLVGC